MNSNCEEDFVSVEQILAKINLECIWGVFFRLIYLHKVHLKGRGVGYFEIFAIFI